MHFYTLYIGIRYAREKKNLSDNGHHKHFGVKFWVKNV